eukprot:c9743_g1_i2.p1 GENE.c9743_g1_i2~~c9743_g1_i2.p1  ORF type:complete len:386 (+),score=97.91 c9743_g1_i2:77-1159(+)
MADVNNDPPVAGAHIPERLLLEMANNLRVSDIPQTPRATNTPRRLGRRTTSSADLLAEPNNLITEFKPTIVIDNGTGAIKAGFAGENRPRVHTVSVVGRKKNKPSVYESTGKLIDETESHLFIGNEALDPTQDLVLESPLEHGIVKNWDHMEMLWDSVFAEHLEVDPQEHFVVVTEPPLNPREHKEKLAEIMFEAFCVPGIYVGMQALLGLYSEGLTTGMVVDIGDGVTHCVPVYEGYAIPHAIMRQNMAGRTLTSFMSTILRERGYVFNTSAQQHQVRMIKESIAYCALNFEDETANFEDDPQQFEKSYELPDGQLVTLGDQRFRVGEVLFQPSLIGSELLPLPELLLRSYNKCAIDTR